MHHVIAIPNISETDFLQVAEFFVQSEIVGQCLAGMFHFTQGINNRNVREFRHSFNCFMRKCAQDDTADPALDIVSDVAESFARVETLVSLVHKRNRAAEATDSGLER